MTENIEKKQENIEKKQWFQTGILKLAAVITAVTTIIGFVIYGVNYLSNLDADLTKLLLTVCNLIFSLIFCLSLRKNKELTFKDNKSKEDYWKLLDIESYEDKETGKLVVEIGNTKYDPIERAGFNEIRVNMLVKQLNKHLFWFSLILVIVYLAFTADNPLLIGDSLAIYHPLLKIFEDISNFANSIFVFLGFMVLYDITIDKGNKEFNYYMPVAVITIIFLFAYLLFVAFPTMKHANKSDIIISNIQKTTNNETEPEILQFVNKMSKESVKKNEDKIEQIAIIESVVNYYLKLEKLKNPNDPTDGKLSNISEIINNDSPNKVTLNIFLLVIGSFNGLAFALLFGRYISMEHQLWNIEKANYRELLKWGVIIILPIYALAQPLFGSFDINVFGSPKNFANVVFFICLVGKGFFFYITWLLIEKRMLHYYLHLVLVNHGVPKDFDTLFINDTN